MPQDNLTFQLAQAINELYRRTDQLYHDVAKRMGLADCAFEILYNLMMQDGLTQKQLCDAGFSTKQTINSSVRRLQKEGLIEPRTDGSSSRFFLTVKGRHLTEQKMQLVVEAECAAAGIFPADRQRTVIRDINRYLDALAAHLGAIEF